MSLGLEQTLRERLFSHLTGLGFRFFDKQQTGQLLSRVTSDVSQVRFFLGYGLTYSFMHFAKLIAVPILLLRIDVPLALIVIAMMPLIVTISVRFARRSHPVMREAQQRLALVTAHGEETIVGARVVRSFGQEAREVERFRRLTDDVVEREYEVMRIQGRFKPYYMLIPNLTMAALLLVGAHRIDSGAISAGDFTAFFFLVLMITAPLRIIGNLLNRAQHSTASSDRLFELLDADDRIPQREHPTPLPPRPPTARRSASAMSRSATATASRAVSGMLRSTSPPARPWRSSAPPAAARRRSPRSCRASTIPSTAPSRSTASTCASCRCTRPAPLDRHRRTRSSNFFFVVLHRR